MLPKAHIFYGAIFSIILYLIGLSPFNSILIFLSSFLIDFDHYLWYVLKKKDFNLKKAFYFLKEMEKKKPMMMVFHTFEFILLILILSFFFNPFLFILMGMLFHSLLDLIDLKYNNEMRFREFWFTRYLLSEKAITINKIKKTMCHHQVVL